VEKITGLIHTFSLIGNGLLLLLIVLAVLAALSGTVNFCRTRPLYERGGDKILRLVCLTFAAGFLWICWFHYQLYTHISLELPADLADWFNQQLGAAAKGKTATGLPLYDPQNPPRYVMPLWIENEKYYFWFFFYALLALRAQGKLAHHRFRAGLHLLLAVQVAILAVFANPFQAPLPRFFAEVRPWLEGGLAPMARFGLFMRLYPRMIFYYNAEYMWIHPPLLFMAYGCITITFLASVFMLVRRDPAIEIIGYDAAKFGYLLLTLGMLLGYPWALQAWGPSWWWDPKICSSIMMWAVFSTYLHARLYANRTMMWYFSSVLGIVCFLAMVFTVSASFLFPGEHTFQ
jgi:ABC-type transport system involved in cytochrome c biogenesis permease subunit